jgi:hypothetical protein
MARQASQDLSSFMCIVLMCIGFLVTILVINVLVITSNPTNIEITPVVKFAMSSEKADTDGAGVPFFNNKSKEPIYLDVHRDFLVIYPGEERVLAGDLEKPGNALERALIRVEANSERQYVCMLLRPYSALFARRLKKIVKTRGIDVGQELFEAGKAIDYQPAKPGEVEARKPAPAPAVPEPAAPDESPVPETPTAEVAAPTATL